MGLEIIWRGQESERPPLLFVHGSYCGAWIWDEHFLPYFAERGWHCAALSLRGHGGSDGQDRLDDFGIDDYVADVAEAAALLKRPPVVIGHSLGGMVAQRFACRQSVCGLVMLASVGPSGLGPAFTHMALGHTGLLWQLGRLQSLGADSVDYNAVRRGLFSAEMPVADSDRYAHLFQRESQRAANELLLPQWFHLMPRPNIPALVLGGDQDAFIPYGDLALAATFWSADMTVVTGVPHVMMLDSTWDRCAHILSQWLDANVTAA